MRTWKGTVMAGLVLAAALGCAQRDWTRPVGYEGSIVNADAVRHAIERDASIDASRVNVVTEGGVVYITGIVPSQDARRDVEDIAEDVHGVYRIVNRLKVSEEASAIPTALVHGGTCSIVSRVSGQYRYADPVYPLWTPRPTGEAVKVEVWEDIDGARNMVRRTGQRDQLTREEMLSGRERSEVREEIREGDRTIIREEERLREEPIGGPTREREMQERKVRRSEDDPHFLWSGKLKHRDSINISGPRMIRYTYDIGDLHGERTAACDGGPIFVP